MDDDIELNSRFGVRSTVYDALPQQDRTFPTSLPPSYDQTSPRDATKTYGQSYSTSEPTLDIVASKEPTGKLPPKYYMQPSTRKRVLTHVGLATAFVVSLATPLSIMVPIMLSESGFDLDATATYCTSVKSEAKGWGLSDGVSSILNISTAYGSLSFGMAKLIDLVWDVFISRGGQIGLGWITYRVYNAALMRIMEDKLVSYDLFATMTLSWANVLTLRPLVATFFTKLGFKRKLLLFWLSLSILWVALWPTITNAMTGYVAKNTTLVRLKDGTGYANYSDVANEDNLAFQYTQLAGTDTVDNITYANWTGPLLTKSGPNVTLWDDLSQYILSHNDMEYGIFNASIPAFGFFDPDVYDPGTFTNAASVYYYYRNDTYDYSWFLTSLNVQCVATNNWQWGFSTGVFLVFTSLNTCWVIGTYAVWIHMNRKSELSRKHRSMGKYRAAVDMVEAIAADLGGDICAYSDRELGELLKCGPGIKYAVTHRKGSEVAHIGLSSEDDGEKLKLNFGELYGRSEKKKSER